MKKKRENKVSLTNKQKKHNATNPSLCDLLRNIFNSIRYETKVQSLIRSSAILRKFKMQSLFDRSHRSLISTNTHTICQSSKVIKLLMHPSRLSSQRNKTNNNTTQHKQTNRYLCVYLKSNAILSRKLSPSNATHTYTH